MVDIAHRVGIRSSADAVYNALATREGVAGWWTQDTSGEAAVGNALKVRFTADGAEIGAMEMKVLDLQPGERVAWQVMAGPSEWIGTTIRFELRQDGEYCIVLFSHEDWAERVEFMHHCSTKWAIFMMSLKALVETGAGQPSPRDVKIDNWN